MTFRLVIAFALLLLPATGHAADCVTVADDYDNQGRLTASLSLSGKDCGPLKVIDRRRDDPNLNVDIYASYVVFDPPGNAAEHRYNGWVGNGRQK